MSTLAANCLTLLDWAKRLDPDGKVPVIAELLSQMNGILDDMLWMEGNLPTGHRSTVRTSLPTPAWRLLNQGVQTSKSTTAQIDEGCAMLEAWSEVDKDLAELNGNTASFRLSEAQAFLEGMNQEMAQTLFYGNAGTAPEEFTGLAARYASLGQNCITGGGGGADNSSIYLVCWSSKSIFGIFPKGSSAGLIHEDHGLQTIETTAGVAATRMRAYQDRFQWKCGIALKDWRYVVRIPNLDISNLVGKSSAADLFDLMIKAIHRIPNMSGVKAAFYMNRSCFQMLDIQKRDDAITAGSLNYNDIDGKNVASFRGIPVRICDSLLENETVVS